MFDINLLAEPGTQSTEIVDYSISFIKANPVNSSKKASVVKKKKGTNKKAIALPSISLYSIIFVAIVAVIFYPMLSRLNLNIPLQLEKISQEVVIDKVLRIILQSKNDYTIESLQFRNGNVLISLTSFNMVIMKFFQEEMDLSNNGAVRIFGDNDNYSMIAKFPWEIISDDDSIRSPKMFFKFVNRGRKALLRGIPPKPSDYLCFALDFSKTPVGRKPTAALLRRGQRVGMAPSLVSPQFLRLMSQICENKGGINLREGINLRN